jgi:hypothetical protein
MLYIGTYLTGDGEVPMYKCDYMKPGWTSTIVIKLSSGKLYSPSLRNIYLYGKDSNGQKRLEHYWSRYLRACNLDDIQNSVDAMALAQDGK